MVTRLRPARLSLLTSRSLISVARGCPAGGVGPDSPATWARIAVTWSNRISPWSAHCSRSAHVNLGSDVELAMAVLLSLRIVRPRSTHRDQRTLHRAILLAETRFPSKM